MITRIFSKILPIVLATVVVCAQQGRPTRSVEDDFVRPGTVERLPGPIVTAMDTMRAEALAAHIAFLASPALEGRALPGGGLDAAAEYVAAGLALAGVPPMEPGAVRPEPVEGRTNTAYFQQVPLREISHPSGQLVIEHRVGDGAAQVNSFTSGLDCVFPERAPAVITGPVVFAGYGIRESAPARDDYRDLDVKGKIVVIVGGLPPGDWQTPALVSRYGASGTRQRFAAKLELAASLGARAILAIETGEAAQRLVTDLSPAGPPAFTAAAAPTFFLPFDDEGARTPPVVRVSARAGDAVLASAGLTTTLAVTAQPRALPGVSATIRFSGDERLVASRNVLGLIRGTDPKLHDQAVVIGAHMDHLGRSGDRLYPGADDNASGVAAILEVAKAFASSAVKPKRTIVFAAWTGEEEGHLGAEYYVRHPLWPLERTSVYLNLDMIGHPWTLEEVKKLVADTHLGQGDAFVATVKPADFIELGVADSVPDLGPVLARAARGTSLALHLDWTDGKSGGSDYREFARRGRPFVRFFGNYFDGYHEPTDTPDKVDARQVLKMARLAFASAWLFADR